MEKVGGDQLKEATVPGRGKKRPLSPASPPSDDGEDSWMSTSDDDGSEFSEEEQEEEEETDDEDYRDTATSEAKKSKSPTLRMITNYMADAVKIQAARLEYFKQAFSEEQQRKATLGDKIRQVQQLAKECGVSEIGPEWFALYKICKNENSMESFIGMSTAEERMAFLNRYDGNSARDGDISGEFRLLVERDERDGDTSGESSEDELFRLMVEMDDDDTDILNGMVMFAIHNDTYCNKAKRRRQLTSASQPRARQAPAREESAYMDAFRDQAATSEAKKSKSSSLRMIKDYMADMVKKQAARNEYFKQAFSEMQQRNMQKKEKQQRKATLRDKIRQVMQLARECGVSETDPEWVALCKINKDENGMEFFIGMSTTEGRKAFFNRYARFNNLI